MHTHNRFILLAATRMLAACSKTPAPTSPTVDTPRFYPTASIQEIMQSIIDPNIDPVWDSVATISTTKGIEEKAPKTDDEWRVVRQHAVVVVEAANLLLIDGRPVAPPGASTSSHAVELSPAEVQKGITAHHADFVRHATALHDAAVEALQAIDARNPERLVNAGGRIDQTCEGCHAQFWYPNDKRPL